MSHTSERRRQANLLGAATLAVEGRMREATEAAVGHGPSAPAALISLHTFLDGTPIEGLRRVLGLTHSGAVRLAARLERAGLLAREPAAGDARAVALRLTPAGHTLARHALDARLGALEDVLAPLRAHDRANLAAAHEQVLAALVDTRADARRVCRQCDAGACGHHTGRCPTTNAARAKDPAAYS